MQNEFLLSARALKTKMLVSGETQETKHEWFLLLWSLHSGTGKLEEKKSVSEK